MSGLPVIVLDASAILAIIFTKEEGRRIAETVEETLAENGQIFVPDLFWYELGNALATAERKKGMTPEARNAVSADVAQLPIVSHGGESIEVRDKTFELALKHDLSYYDASYLELALRRRATLLCADTDLLSVRPVYSVIK